MHLTTDRFFSIFKEISLISVCGKVLSSTRQMDLLK